MCGIVGFVDKRFLPPDPEGVAGAMADHMRRRGPDAGGVWGDAEAGVFLAHRRLSIIDLSPGGAQPMVSADGRWVISYNGELYNTDELAEDLRHQGFVARGSSDTEVLLEGIARWGIEKTLTRANGMFAFAAWDRSQRRLYLARDRLGIKPLYWAQAGGLFLFASDLGALSSHPSWRPTLNRDAIAAYLRFGYIPAPDTIWREAHKLRPGHFLVYGDGREPRSVPYWSLDEVQSAAQQERWRDPIAAVDALDELLRDAVGRQMVSDVPLGAFLSGGIDSSVVVALMQAQSARSVQTFSIGFNEQGYDEAQHAKAVARHLGTDHHELYIAPGHAVEVLPEVAGLYDEPFSDSSQIPTYLVSELARSRVTVALSGDGGDESFGGYGRYAVGQQLWSRVARVPGWLRGGLSSTMRLLDEPQWDRVGSLLPRSLRPAMLGMRVHRLARRIRSSTATEIYLSQLSQWHQPEQLVIGGREAPTIAADAALERRLPDMLDRMQYIDTLMYLPDDILTKVDRASMGVSLECRVPLLDHRVVEFAWRIPVAWRQRDGTGKWPLRQVLYRYVPRSLVDRPKMGFGVPIDHWLRSELKDWAWSLLSPGALERTGVIHAAPVIAAWNAHQSGEQDLHYRLWTILMLQDWLGRQSGYSA